MKLSYKQKIVIFTLYIYNVFLDYLKIAKKYLMYFMCSLYCSYWRFSTSSKNRIFAPITRLDGVESYIINVEIEGNYNYTPYFRFFFAFYEHNIESLVEFCRWFNIPVDKHIIIMILCGYAVRQLVMDIKGGINRTKNKYFKYNEINLVEDSCDYI